MTKTPFFDRLSVEGVKKMSKDKSGMKITENADALMISAGESFSEKASVTREIIQRLQQTTSKKVSLLLSPKSKSFQDTLFLLRRTIIDAGLEDARIVLTSQAGPSFKQKIDENNDLQITTHDYTVRSDGRNMSIRTTKSGKIFPNENIAKEIAFILASEKPTDVQIIFIRGEKEKHEAYEKRIQNLENFFVSKAKELYHISSLKFMKGTAERPMLISSYIRPENSLLLYCEERKNLPVTHSKHKRGTEIIFTGNGIHTME